MLITAAAMNRMKKEELCEDLKQRSVSTVGLNKSDCLRLLCHSLLLPVDQSHALPSRKTPKPLVGFPVTAYWNELKSEEAIVSEPENRFQSA